MKTLLLKARVRSMQDKGATAVEYGLLVAGIAVAIVVTVGLVGGQLNTLFNTVVTALQ
jgi:pilus assembly protein Flp/PilA